MPNRTLVVLDLGVARPLARGVPGTAIGTPGYAAPEQYQGLADERSDLYSLGATLHYMVTGYDAEHEPPFRHPPVRQLNPQLGPATEALVAKLLQLVPGERPPSAQAVRDYLVRFENVQLHATTVAYCSWYRRRFTMRILPIGLAGVGVAAIAEMNPIGFPAWLLSGLNAGVLPAVAVVGLVSAALALRIPSFAASAIRNGAAPARLALPSYLWLVVVGLTMLYAFTLSQAVHWILLPALLVLPYVVILVCQTVSAARVERARRGLEAAMNARLP